MTAIDKQVFPSQDFIGWYSVAAVPTSLHISLQEQVCNGETQWVICLLSYIQFAAYSSTPLFLMLQPDLARDAQSLPIKIYEPTVEIRDRRSRSIFVEVTFGIETTEAERIAVDFSTKGADNRPSRMSPIRMVAPMTDIPR
jgi:COP9 signalosome complex subunit 6